MPCSGALRPQTFLLALYHPSTSVLHRYAGCVSHGSCARCEDSLQLYTLGSRLECILESGASSIKMWCASLMKTYGPNLSPSRANIEGRDLYTLG